MEIRQILLARSIRQVSVIPPLEHRLDIARKLQERYGFLKIPLTFEELFPTDPNSGIEFLHGKSAPRDRTIVIERLQFLPNMILADTRSSTDDADTFLEDYVRNANESRAQTITPSGATVYVSQLEFTWDRELDTYAPSLKPLSRELDRQLLGYGLEVPPFGTSAIHIHFDQKRYTGLAPGAFAIERRADFPYSSKTYFSQAPLKTSDHINFLKQLEALGR